MFRWWGWSVGGGLSSNRGGGACNSHSDSIDSEIKSVTKNSSTETWTFSLLEKYTENFKKKIHKLGVGFTT